MIIIVVDYADGVGRRAALMGQRAWCVPGITTPPNDAHVLLVASMGHVCCV